MKICKSVHTEKLDKTEFAMLTLLLILYEARNLFPSNKDINDQLSELFKAMDKHFKENYSDTAMRLGTLIIMLGELGVSLLFKLLVFVKISKN